MANSGRHLASRRITCSPTRHSHPYARCRRRTIRCRVARSGRKQITPGPSYGPGVAVGVGQAVSATPSSTTAAFAFLRFRVAFGGTTGSGRAISPRQYAACEPAS